MMQQGQQDYAIRKALEHFDRWNACTDAFELFSPSYYEICGVIEDAVKIGARVACGASAEFDESGELSDTY